MSKTIEIKIKGGKTSVEVSGGQGSECERITEELIQMLGGQVIDTQKKPEYYVELDGIEQYVTQD